MNTVDARTDPVAVYLIQALRALRSELEQVPPFSVRNQELRTDYAAILDMLHRRSTP